jgi:transglutaminase-like putative cysteine protease
VGWRLRIEHVTEVKYAGPVRTSFNEARMTPMTLPTQATLEARVTVGPGDVPPRSTGPDRPPVPAWSYNDYWGTHVTVFDLPEAHDYLRIRATATVETTAPAQREGDALGWDAIGQTVVAGRLLEFCLPTPLTALAPGIADDAIAGVRALPPAMAAETISERVRDRVAYMPGATGVRTDARQAWRQGQGVCQDMAHVTVALLRRAGLPARYVSGYLHPNGRAEPGSAAVGQSHAWVEYWAGGWSPLDPTSGAPVAERHVVVARGRDYNDVPPLKGIYHGPPETSMDVAVEVTRLA